MDDKVLKTLVEDELEYQPDIDTADIGVSVEHGIVHLNGHVPTFAQKKAVEAAVKRVKGVRGYVEDLAVRSYPDPESDDAIANRVANVLEWDVTLPKGVIKVNVEGGWVTLSGEVEWAFQRHTAENIAGRLAGIRGVINTITMKSRIEARDIKHRIESALDRHADIQAHAISVSVDGSKVKLSGKVRAWYERDLAERAAWAAPGVEAVEDGLTVTG
ncbi:BON domain-containing protein [Phenylobacterium immobile]|uniref:BON domain-containing protein n=1 Tax=Phenylobacterium immobile TaxID=21 RepID=UPI000AF5710C|nr:BON domain-containing protein [Phenylobacterium immobile]